MRGELSNGARVGAFRAVAWASEPVRGELSKWRTGSEPHATVASLANGARVGAHATVANLAMAHGVGAPCYGR